MKKKKKKKKKQSNFSVDYNIIDNINIINIHKYLMKRHNVK